MKAEAPTDAEYRRIFDDTTEVGDEVAADDAARAAQNVSLWTSYLPPDCIDAMIAMGWDRTT